MISLTAQYWWEIRSIVYQLSILLIFQLFSKKRDERYNDDDLIQTEVIRVRWKWYNKLQKVKTRLFSICGSLNNSCSLSIRLYMPWPLWIVIVQNLCWVTSPSWEIGRVPDSTWWLIKFWEEQVRWPPHYCDTFAGTARETTQKYYFQQPLSLICGMWHHCKKNKKNP